MAKECPTCRRRFPDRARFCAADRTVLVEAAADAEAPPPAPEVGAARDAAAQDPWVGRTLDGRYRITARIGSGGSGVVYRAQLPPLERAFAIKLLAAHLLDDAQAVARFHREARAVSRLDHEHIVRVHDFAIAQGREQDIPYLVMDDLEGTSLREMLRQNHHLPVALALDFAAHVAEAMEHAHGRGVVHRDLKAENILLTQHDGEPDWIMITDFGIARILTEAPITRQGQICGTLSTMPPELLKDAALVSRAVDVWALGVLLHEMIVGEPANGEMARFILLEGSRLRLSDWDMEARVDERLDALVADMLQGEPERRPTMAQVAERLKALRPSYPERSLLGLLAAPTRILTEGERGAALSGAETMLLPTDHAVRPTILLGVLREREGLDVLAAALHRAGEDLQQQLALVAEGLWGAGWPREAAALREDLDACQYAERQDQVRLGLLRHRQAQVQAHVRELEGAYRDRLQDIKERLRQPGLASAEEPALRGQRDALERLLLAPGGGGSSPEGEDLRAARREVEILRAQIEGCNRKLRQLSEARERTLCGIARLVERDAIARPGAQGQALRLLSSRLRYYESLCARVARTMGRAAQGA